MQRAGAAAAAEIATRFPEQLSRGAFVLAGPGNNGGDGWVIARALAAAGVAVNVFAPESARSADCVVERDLALPVVNEATAFTGEGVVIDSLLGTGAAGAIRGAISPSMDILRTARERKASIIAVDLPSGLDATTGAVNDAVRADLTLTFGTIKRGHLIARGACGAIVAVDIGLTSPTDSTPELIDAAWVRASLPPVAAESHKGTRKKLVLHGGGEGMSGAVILGLRAALASGIGMVKARVHSSTIGAIQAAVPAALTDVWSSNREPDTWANVLVIGPGLGQGADTRAAVEGAAARHRGPMLLDADALTAFAGDLPALRNAIAGRSAIITPHPVECARLMDLDVQQVLDRRFEIGAELAGEIGAVVLLKGVPTIVSAPDGRRLVIAAGSPVLAAGGSGDVLCGIAGTLLAQMDDPMPAAACAAWIHGRAAELTGPNVRGTTLDSVLEMLPNAWRIETTVPRYPILAELRAVPT
jgi:ADP-dependent NAD(P)H-hydrate dehydratase / NAD(P)H-hydrate epimerase